MAKFGVWGASFNDLTKYLREAQSAKVQITERTDSQIKLNVTDELDNYMYDHALTIKVDIPDSWTTVTATQGGKEITLVSNERYKNNMYYTEVSCTIEDGYLYIDVVPDCGEVVIVAGEKNSEADYKDRVTVTFETNGGELKNTEYEKKVVIGECIDKLPTPEKWANKFLGWYKDEALTEKVELTDVYTESVTLYAAWEEIPLCTDGTPNHNWAGWLPAGNGVDERKCKDCGLSEQRTIEE